MKRILVVSWFFPPINSSEGLVTYKLLNNSKYSYDVYTQNSNDSWSYGKNDYLPLNNNINCIFSSAENLNDFVEKALEYYNNNMDKYDIVMTRSMPEESHIIGLKIKQLNPNIKWIASFGDPIGNNPFVLRAVKSQNPYTLQATLRNGFSFKRILSLKRIIKNHIFKTRNKKEYDAYIGSKNALEFEIVKKCDYIICNSKKQLEYIAKNNRSSKDKFIVIPHSFDRKLYKTVPLTKNKKIVFTYIGHLDDIRTPELLLKAVLKLKEDQKDLSNKAEFNFYGDISDKDKLFILNNDLLDTVHINKPISYLESLQTMQKSDWLFHIDANLFDIIDNNIFFAAKLADYLGAGSKIFGITMLDGASAEILRKTNALTATYSCEEIYNWLYLIIYEGYNVNMNLAESENYNSEKVVAIMDALIERIK